MIITEARSSPVVSHASGLIIIVHSLCILSVTTHHMDSFNSQIVANTIGAGTLDPSSVPTKLGVLISYALFGMTTTQTYIYHSRFADDSRKLRGLVVLLWYPHVQVTRFENP
ncbi:hypothetical protein B0H14DRAFT_2751630 [Mycena olivaceomarginata]|nr:hypothetical protein B0H14DRAFT_2751630 [Mycena olivaceomarginata]